MSAIDEISMKFISGIPVSQVSVTNSEWLAVLAEIEQLRQERDGLRADAVRYRWLRRRVGATGPAGNDYTKWSFVFPTNLTLKVSELMISDIKSDFDSSIDAAMAKEQGE